MKKNIQSNYRWILVVAMLTILCCITGCSSNKTDAERYTEKMESVAKVDSEVLLELKEVCKTALEDENVAVKEIFIYSNYIDGYFCEAHVLTEKEEYHVYSIESSYSGPLNMMLTNGPLAERAPIASEVHQHLFESQPVVDKEKKIINLG